MVRLGNRTYRAYYPLEMVGHTHSIQTQIIGEGIVNCEWFVTGYHRTIRKS